MVTRRKTKSRKVKTRKTAVKRKSPAKKKAYSYNAKANMKTFKALEKQVAVAWDKLRKDVKRKDKQAILKGRNHLMLLLGECNYMSRECLRFMQKTKRR